ncbi:MAG: hypothetical protein IJ523_10445 [Succinivibrionaceae bacterium]|nr:hypothetical protein [Succinivibrionaceae bacterium]
MRVETIKPNIVRIAIHQEQGDPHYGSCLWGYYDFDLDRYMLNIQSDCGEAAYRWCETPDSESFLHLMARINDDYLLDKLFKAEKVDVSGTVAEVREHLGVGEDEGWQDDSLTDDEREEREEALNELEGLLENVSKSYGAVEATLEDWNADHGFGLDCIYERVVTDFTAWQKRIVEIFRDYVQPRIREIIKEEAECVPDE